MLYEQMLAGEALKRLCDGRFASNDGGSFHVYSSDKDYAKDRNCPWNYKWSVTMLGALFLLDMQFKGSSILADDSGGNWWTNALVERHIQRLDDFKSGGPFINRVRALYGFTLPDGLSPEDKDFKYGCKERTRYLLTTYFRSRGCPTSYWKDLGIGV